MRTKLGVYILRIDNPIIYSEDTMKTFRESNEQVYYDLASEKFAKNIIRKLESLN